MDALRHDVRFAIRGFAKSPAFTAVVVMTLALGIGANSAIFGLMDQVMLRALPVAHPERLVVLDAPGPFTGRSSSSSSTLTPLSHPMFVGLRDRAPVFSGVLAHRALDVHLSVGGDTQNASGSLVSGTFFPVLGLQPAAGRLLGPDDDRTPGGHPVVVLGHRLFQSRFGSDPGVVGRMVRVNGDPMTVVGVAPAGFNGVEVGRVAEVFIPMAMQSAAIPTWPNVLPDWRTRWLTVMARLRDGESRASAQTAVNVLYAQLLQEDAEHTSSKSEHFRAAFLAKRLELRSGARGTSDLRDEARAPLLLLMGMVGLVLLIACANVANLLLARGSSRQRELAVRVALGAGRGRLLRQLLTESVLLASAGGALGLLVAMGAGRMILAALPFDDAARTLSGDPDLRVALFAFGLSVVTGMVFGLLPALQATRLAVSPTLKAAAGAVIGGSAPFRFRRGLVVAQIALSLLLLVGAGLFVRSLGNLRALDPGFRPDQLLTFRVDPALAGYDPARRHEVFERLRDELAAEPGVRAVTLADTPLMTNSDNGSTVIVEGYVAKEDEDMNPNFNRVGPDFFATMGVGLLRGRDLHESDRLGAPKVAVVNESFARYFFRNQDPLGRRFGRARDKTTDVEIVGVVKDGKAMTLRDRPTRYVYLPYAQQEVIGEMTYYVRTAHDDGDGANALSPRVRDIVRRVDPQLPVTQLKTMRAQIRESLYVDRMVASLSAAFGLLATLLAALGLYAVMAYAVSLRTREIGIRMALGAERGAVLAMVLREVALLVAIGIALGLPGGYGLGRLIESQLFGLSARDPLTFAVATSALVLAALAAGYLPARRATRVDPMVALRCE